jgi:subtilisin-like proprotein convertase family protein
VRVALAHPWVSDLRLQLRSPYSTSVTLMNRPGYPINPNGTSSDLISSVPITFSSSASTAASANPESMGNTLAKTGVVCRDDGRCIYRANPDGDLTSAPGGMAAFSGQASEGLWRFCVSDNYQYDIGTINEVALDLACLPGGTATPAPTSTPAPTPGPNVCAPVTINPNSRIPDNQAAPTCFTLPVTQTGLVTALSLRLGISHTYVSDLKIQMRSPNSTTLTLLNRPGVPTTRFGDSSDLWAKHVITFSDGATVNAEAMGGTIGGTSVICRDDGRCGYLPNPDGDISSTIYNLAGFAGERSAGDWQVCVSDLYPKDIGTVNSLQLDLVCSAAPALAALPDVDAMDPPTPTPDDAPMTPTPDGQATATTDVKVEAIATPTIPSDVDLNTLDKPEEPDWLPMVYMPVLVVAE